MVKEKKVCGVGGSCQIMVGQSYMLVVAGYSLVTLGGV